MSIIFTAAWREPKHASHLPSLRGAELLSPEREIIISPVYSQSKLHKEARPKLVVTRILSLIQA